MQIGPGPGQSAEDLRRQRYEQEFSSFRHSAADWNALIADLDAQNLLVRPASWYEVSVNWTGLDECIQEVEALGSRLLQDHGLNG